MQSWLDGYSADHRNPTNQVIHWICVPPIVWSVVALLWNMLFNTMFEWWERRSGHTGRPLWVRLVHTFLFEAGLVVVLVPESGDSIQTLKAGLMEIADVFVVNKADRDGADATIRDIKGMIALGDRQSGELIGITFWESEQAMRASEELGDRTRSDTSSGVNPRAAISSARPMRPRCRPGTTT